MDAGGRRRREQAVEEARSRDGQDVRYAASGQAGNRPPEMSVAIPARCKTCAFSNIFLQTREAFI